MPPGASKEDEDKNVKPSGHDAISKTFEGAKEEARKSASKEPISRRHQKQPLMDDGRGKPLQPEEEEDTGKASDGRVEREHNRQMKEELIERTTHLMCKHVKDMVEQSLEKVKRDEIQDVELPCRSILV